MPLPSLSSHMATLLHFHPGVKIVRDRVVCMDYTIRLGSGQVVESSLGAERLTYLHGHKQIVPGVEHAIEGLESGSTLEIVVPPEEAYGQRDASGVFVVPRAAFPAGEEVGPGMLFSAQRPDGRTLTFRVVEANDELVLVDTNHPLAGETLHISVVVHEVRDATAEELLEGRANPTLTSAREHFLA
jgi:FKBP-type peptidyl-prolyl cis-trans isomerase SlyD